MGLAHSPRIVTDNLTMYLDAGNPKSYSGSGTTWYDLTKNANNGTLVRTTYSAANKCMELDGLGESGGSPEGAHINFPASSLTTEPTTRPNGVTYDMWIRFQGAQAVGHSILWGGGTINHLEWRGTLAAGNYRTEAVTQNGYSFGGTNDGGHVIGGWFNLQLVFANDEFPNPGSPTATGNRPVRWYRDGRLFQTGDMSSGTNPDGEYFNPSRFGQSTGGGGFFYAQSFWGDIGAFKLYNRTLTDSEVKQNFYALRSRYI